jgi:uncharacterized membrane protein (DUF4010 family)
MNTIEWTVQLRFAVALALGFLVGLERESTKIEQQKMVFGGVRTHPLISLFGFGCAWLHQMGIEFLLPAGLLAMTVLTGIAYLAKIKSDRFGTTSEISALLTFITGALALLVDVWAAMAMGVINTILLSEKARLENYVESLNKVEFLATLKFLLVTLIILPVLPNQEYTRFQLNPTRIWEIVILVSTIGFIGYLLAKLFGDKVGLWLSGIMGGIVSSTAVTVAAARLSRVDPARGPGALQASLLSAGIMYLRMLILIAIVNSSFVSVVLWKFLLLAVASGLLAIRVRGDVQREQRGQIPALQNPFEITPSLVFAALFVVLIILTTIVRDGVGSAGLLGLGAVAGFADITPFVLSIVQSGTGQTPIWSWLPSIETAAILVAMLSNTVARGAYFWYLVPGERRETTWRFCVLAIIHVPLAFLP